MRLRQIKFPYSFIFQSCYGSPYLGTAPTRLLHGDFANPNRVGGTSLSFYITRRWHLGHSHDPPNHHLGNQNKGDRAIRLGLAVDIGLAAGKAVTGYLSGSTAIIADAAHSISDVVLSGVVLASFKAGQAPKDKEHPYGHGKFESLGSLGISCMLIASAGGIAWHALDILLRSIYVGSNGHNHGMDMDHPFLALSITIIAICAKEGLYKVTMREGEAQGSGLMKANAWHHRADAVSSLVALLGVGGSIIGVTFLDPLAGLVVSAMILRAGIQTCYQSVMELVDAAISPADTEPMRRTILEIKGVEGCHRLRGRRAGSQVFVDVHIEVEPSMSISAAHEIGENVRTKLQTDHPQIAEAFIHIDPSDVQTDHPQIAEAFIHIDPSDVQTDHPQIAEAFVHIDPSDHPSEFHDIEAAVAKIYKDGKVQRIKQYQVQGRVFLQIDILVSPQIGKEKKF